MKINLFIFTQEKVFRGVPEDEMIMTNFYDKFL